MDNQSKRRIIPEGIDSNIRGRRLRSFLEVLQFLDGGDTKPGLDLIGAFPTGSKEKNALKVLPQAFLTNTTLKRICFTYFKVDKIQVAKAVVAILRKNEVVLMIFENMKVPKKCINIITGAFQERTTPVQLKFEDCSPGFVREMILASCLKCFSLTLFNFEWRNAFKRPVRNLLSRGSLYYLDIEHINGLNEKTYSELARCILFLPGLKRLNLRFTPVPVAAFMRLVVSLKAMIRRGNSTTLEVLNIAGTELDNCMAYSCFTLLEFNLISRLQCTAKNNIFPPLITKIICSVAERTRKLNSLRFTNTFFHSETNFDSFVLQKLGNQFRTPFTVNPRTI